MKILIISFVLVISSCGMQGDLYLPEEEVKSDGATISEAPLDTQQDIEPKTKESY